MDDFDEINDDVWEFDTIKGGQKTVKPKMNNSVSLSNESDSSKAQNYTRNPESLPLVRMFMTAEQKAAELVSIPNGQMNTSSPPPKYLPDTSPKTSELPNLESPTRRNDYLGDNLNSQTDFLSHHSGRLVPGAPRNLMNTPVSKLTPMTRTASADSGKPVIRARSNSEQRPGTDETSLVVPKISNVSSPLARRVRSATTLRPSDQLPLKALVANKQLYNQMQHDEKVKSSDSHRRSISADNATSTKKV